MYVRKITTMIATTLLVLMMNAVAQAADFTVEIKGMDYSPKELSVSLGDKVTFINKDDAPHTASSTDGSFETGELSKGMSSTITLDRAGSFNYYCALHPSMNGKILVK